MIEGLITFHYSPTIENIHMKRYIEERDMESVFGVGFIGCRFLACLGQFLTQLLTRRVFSMKLLKNFEDLLDCKFDHCISKRKKRYTYRFSVE